MDQQWYYGQEHARHGPFSAVTLQALASAGEILRTDTVWKEGVEQGALASRVKHLFVVAAVLSPIAAPTPPIEEQAAPVPESIASEPHDEQVLPASQATNAERETTPILESLSVSAYQSTPSKLAVRKSRALAIRGAKVVGQDGSNVQFKKFCTTCGHEDGHRSAMKIRTGLTRLSYYCPKCRKPRSVELQGIN
jgi:hypothetical protein